MKHKHNEERGQGGPWPPNKEQNWENKEQNGGQKAAKLGLFWGVVIHENTCCKTMIKS